MTSGKFVPTSKLRTKGAKPKSAHAKLVGEVRSLLSDKQAREKTHRVTALEAALERVVTELERVRSSKFVLPTNPTKKAVERGKPYCRVALPDTHGCFVDGKAFAAVIEDLIAIQPQEIILLGDHVDCGGFLAEHQTLGYVAEAEYSFQDDQEACNIQLDAIQKACPNAKIEYLEGNHERRIERWIMTQKLRNQKDARWLKSIFSPVTVLHLAKRGIKYYEQCKFYDGLSVPGTIKRGKCFFTHGSYTGSDAAKKHLERFGGNVVFGHIHSESNHTTRSATNPRTGAWSPGCLCVQQRLWNHTNPTTWVHGYSLQAVQGDGAFLNINIPIISGKSYLSPMARELGA